MTELNNMSGIKNYSGGRFYVQKGKVLICGKPKEVRHLLASYANRYRTVKELITHSLN